MNLIMSISLVSHATSLLPLIWTFRRRSNSRTIKLLQILTAASFLFDTVSLFYGLKGYNTYPINNLFLLAQFVLLLLIYAEAFSWPRRSVYWAGGIYAALFLLNYLVIQRPYSLNSYAYTTTGVILIVFALLYFRFLLVNLPETFVHRSPMVWINIAVLLYFGGNLFLFMLYNFFASGIWILHNMLNITKNILFFVAVWQSQRKISSTSS